MERFKPKLGTVHVEPIDICPKNVLPPVNTHLGQLSMQFARSKAWSKVSVCGTKNPVLRAAFISCVFFFVFVICRPCSLENECKVILLLDHVLYNCSLLYECCTSVNDQCENKDTTASCMNTTSWFAS